MALLWESLRDNARAVPASPAVASRERTLSYAELHDESNRLGGYLGSVGIGPGIRVGLLIRKSARSIVAMLGVNKAGAAYVPIDWNAPLERVVFLMQDCALGALITTESRLGQLEAQISRIPSIKLVVVCDSDVDGITCGSVRAVSWKTVIGTRPSFEFPKLNDTEPAYVLYTSGSTGRPKGVVLSHANSNSFVEWAARTFLISATDRLANHAPMHFDLSVFDVFAALRCGACVSLVPDDLAPFPRALAEWVERARITVWYSVPSALTRLVREGDPARFAFSSVRLVLFAGETFPIKHLRETMKHFGKARFFNLYGPTETNVCTFCEVPRPLDPAISCIPIGRACDNVEVFAVNDGRPIQPGDVGELYVKGPTVMIGYWGSPDKTRTALVRDPRHPRREARIYRTGDFVRLETNGDYTFLGRRDGMVKSRGYRIEIGEIEQTLHEHEGINEAAVVAIPDEDLGTRLKAFVVTNSQTLDARGLRAFCAKWLPRYMIPEEFVLCAALPRTSTGKLDREMLSRKARVYGAGAG